MFQYCCIILSVYKIRTKPLIRYRTCSTLHHRNVLHCFVLRLITDFFGFLLLAKNFIYQKCENVSSLRKQNSKNNRFSTSLVVVCFASDAGGRGLNHRQSLIKGFEFVVTAPPPSTWNIGDRATQFAFRNVPNVSSEGK